MVGKKTILVSAALVLLYAYLAYPPEYPVHAHNENNAVLVTGASSGIGRDAALTLARAGYFVFAGVRRREDGDALLQEANSSHLAYLLLDVTKEDDVLSAARAVEASGKSLVGLINNAGVIAIAPMEVSHLIMRDVFEVNVFAYIRVTNAFLPLLRKAQGRLILLSSLTGKMSSAVTGLFCATKHAIEGIADAYRYELASQNISVSAIIPGIVETNMATIINNTADHWRTPFSSIPESILDLYNTMVRRWTENFRMMYSGGYFNHVNATSAAIYSALSDPRPKPRYLVGVDAHVFNVLKQVLPDGAFDSMNRNEFG